MGADEIMSELPVDRFADSTQRQALRRPDAAHAGQPAAVVFPQPVADLAALSSIADVTQALGFLEHPLRKTASRLSFFEGPEKARILVISDKPRNEEDKSGLVFADRHRALLTSMLGAIGLRLEEVALMNLVPWRPPGNAPLKEQDVVPLLALVQRAIQIIAPQFILGFTAVPGIYLANGDASFPRQRGKWLASSGAQLLSTFHPEELLKTPSHKRLAWRDLLAFKERLDG